MNVRHPHPMVVALLLAFAPGCTPDRYAGHATEHAAPAAPDPLVFDTWVPGPCSPNGQPQGQCPPGDLFRVRLVPVAEGLKSPRHMAFTPNGDLLITELAEPPSDPATGNQAVQGRPGTRAHRARRRARSRSRSRAGRRRASRPARCSPSSCIRSSRRTASCTSTTSRSATRCRLARSLARGSTATPLLDVQEIFEADSWIPGGPMAGRAAFGPDGTIYLTVNDHVEHDGRDGGNEPLLAQQLDNDVGKVLRIRDDGGIPADNPFVGREGANAAGVHVRAAQRDGFRLASRDRRALDDGDRADGRRRDQRPARRPELRLAARVARQELQPQGAERQPLVPARAWRCR